MPVHDSRGLTEPRSRGQSTWSRKTTLHSLSLTLGADHRSRVRSFRRASAAANDCIWAIWAWTLTVCSWPAGVPRSGDLDGRNRAKRKSAIAGKEPVETRAGKRSIDPLQSPTILRTGHRNRLKPPFKLRQRRALTFSDWIPSREGKDRARVAARGHPGALARPKVPQEACGAARCHRKWTLDPPELLLHTQPSALEMAIRRTLTPFAGRALRDGLLRQRSTLATLAR